MFSRVKNAFVNAVTGSDSQTSLASSTSALSASGLSPKFPYTRPLFLSLNLMEEVPLSADHRVRPIIVPRERDALPWCSGYAECVNAGKSVKNEDQASVYEFKVPISGHHEENNPNQDVVSVTYFGIFDGHAGYGAAVCAAKQLHFIIEEKLLEVMPMVWNTYLGLPQLNVRKEVSHNSLIIGVLEKSFLLMDQKIADDREKYLPAGGCTAVVSLFILGRVYVANAGDSRVVEIDAVNGAPTSMQISFDYTPESEQRRIRKLAEQKPELLGGEYTWREYQKHPSVNDLGKTILFKDAFMTGWTTKILRHEDLKMPIISGEGKRSRVMNTIGVTRGFGDHDLKAINSKIPIKPFLCAHPEVSVIELSHLLLEDTNAIVMGTDGLWDVTSNDKCAEIVVRILKQFPNERHKYISAAQALVAFARGKPYGESLWKTSEGRMASADDVSCFVIPLKPHWEMHRKFLSEMQLDGSSTAAIISADGLSGNSD